MLCEMPDRVLKPDKRHTGKILQAKMIPFYLDELRHGAAVQDALNLAHRTRRNIAKGPTRLF